MKTTYMEDKENRPHCLEQPAVEKALQRTFGVSDCDEIERMTKGLSNALSYRIVVKGHPYFLKIARTDELSAPARYFEYMKEGAEAGIAPKVWYLNADDKISITDFVEQKPFPVEKAKELMPGILRKLHKLPPFYKPENGSEYMDGMVRRVLAADYFPGNIADEILRGYTRIQNLPPCPVEDLVSCHNDLKPENFIFDGENAWIVDWEAAFLNDRYSDLAIIANFVADNDEDEHRYLQYYFEEEPDEHKEARFFIMRQLLHIHYLAAFIFFASKTVPIKIDEGQTGFKDFHERIWIGEIDLADDNNKLQYALVHLNRLLSNIHSTRFEKSLACLSGRQLGRQLGTV